jgi:hypothetical protein
MENQPIASEADKRSDLLKIDNINMRKCNKERKLMRVSVIVFMEWLVLGGR